MTRERLTLKKYELKALLTHASKDLTRQHLSAVIFDGTKGVCAATDGHSIAIRDCDMFDGKFVVSRGSLEMAEKLVLKKGSVSVTSKELAVCNEFGVVLAAIKPTLVEVDRFPPYHKVIEGYAADSRLEPIGLQPGLMSRACDLFESIAGRSPNFLLAGNEKLGNVELSAMDNKTGAQWHVIIMPMRIDDYVPPAKALKARLEKK